MCKIIFLPFSRGILRRRKGNKILPFVRGVPQSGEGFKFSLSQGEHPPPSKFSPSQGEYP